MSYDLKKEMRERNRESRNAAAGIFGWAGFGLIVAIAVAAWFVYG